MPKKSYGVKMPKVKRVSVKSGMKKPKISIANRGKKRTKYGY